LPAKANVEGKTMRPAFVFAILLIALCGPLPRPAAAAGGHAVDGLYQGCRTDRSNVTTCKRPIVQEAEARLQCRWKCAISCPAGQCVEICRGSGRQCFGKRPPGW
jgi:hypothetical protein